MDDCARIVTNLLGLGLFILGVIAVFCTIPPERSFDELIDDADDFDGRIRARLELILKRNDLDPIARLQVENALAQLTVRHEAPAGAGLIGL